MTIREALAGARERLRAAGSDEAEVDAEVLLRYVLNLDRAIFLRLLSEPLSDAEARAFERALSRRLAGEPSAYITGTREFHGLNFKVTASVLIPRPETEMLVEAVIAEAGRRNSEFTYPGARTGDLSVVDVGTGSGAIAVALARALPAASIYATDISSDALLLARENARCHGVDSRISFRRGDLLEPLDTGVDVIAANLPYITEADWQRLPRGIREHEPRLALAAGADGLDAIRALLCQAPYYLKAAGSVFLEFGFGQAEAIEAIARDRFPAAAIEARSDFARIPRLLVIETRGLPA